MKNKITDIHIHVFLFLYMHVWGWSGGAMVLGKLPMQGLLLIWIRVGQGPTVLVVGAGDGCLDIFSLVYHFSCLSPSLWEMARYRLKYCLKGLLSNKQPTNQHACMCQNLLKITPNLHDLTEFSPIALRTNKTLLRFGWFECNRVKKTK